MKQVEFLGLYPVTNSTDLSWRTIHLTVENLDAGNRLLFHPAVWTTKNRHLVPTRNQMLREKLAIRQRTVNVSAGNKLQDFQGKAHQNQVLSLPVILTSIAVGDHINLRRRSGKKGRKA